jgi:hypothetical protein
MEETTYKELIKFHLTSPLDVVIEWKVLNWVMVNKHTTLEICTFMKNILQWRFKHWHVKFTYLQLAYVSVMVSFCKRDSEA